MNRSWKELPVDVQPKSEMVQRRVGMTILVSVVGIFVLLLFLIAVNIGFVLAKGSAALPDIKLLENWYPSQSTRIFDRNGALIANYHGDEDRVVVPLSEISPNIQRAVMAIEDNRFYEHQGVDVRGTIRAFAQNLKGGDVQGGSTVTQQLVKNLFLSPERSFKRKIAEALLAIRVEQHYPKNKIMELYLNQVYWGNQAYGIEKAARRYYRKPASDLTIAESALLAGLLKAPEGLSPFAYPEPARRRQIEVLAKMMEYGYISEAQYQAAINEKIQLNRETRIARHPFFVTYVIQELVKQYGEDVVRRGGLRVYTTMDQEVQQAAELALLDKVKKLPKYSNVDQGALVSFDVETGEILAMVGGVDFEKNQFNNVTQARRAVGSTFKPIVYLTGFRLGLITPESPIVDRPVSFNTGYSIWHPHNWDGRYMGPMTVRRALALSRNTTTVQVGMKVGIEEIIKTARLAGVTSPIDANFSSLLGSSGVSPLEMATVYATFARNGVYMPTTGIRKVIDTHGREIPRPRSERKRVFDPDDVANLVSILVDVVENGTGKNARLPERQVAGKTGTTDKMRDIWFAGFTPDMVSVVWMGNTRYIPLNGMFSSDAAQVWHDFADRYYAMRDIPATKFPPPPPKDKQRAPRLDAANSAGGAATSPRRQKDPAEPAAPVPVPSLDQMLDPGPKPSENRESAPVQAPVPQ